MGALGFDLLLFLGAAQLIFACCGFLLWKLLGICFRWAASAVTALGGLFGAFLCCFWRGFRAALGPIALLRGCWGSLPSCMRSCGLAATPETSAGVSPACPDPLVGGQSCCVGLSSLWCLCRSLGKSISPLLQGADVPGVRAESSCDESASRPASSSDHRGKPSPRAVRPWSSWRASCGHLSTRAALLVAFVVVLVGCLLACTLPTAPPGRPALSTPPPHASMGPVWGTRWALRPANGEAIAKFCPTSHPTFDCVADYLLQSASNAVLREWSLPHVFIPELPLHPPATLQQAAEPVLARLVRLSPAESAIWGQAVSLRGCLQHCMTVAWQLLGNCSFWLPAWWLLLALSHLGAFRQLVHACVLSILSGLSSASLWAVVSLISACRIPLTASAGRRRSRALARVCHRVAAAARRLHTMLSQPAATRWSQLKHAWQSSLSYLAADCTPVGRIGPLPVARVRCWVAAAAWQLDTTLSQPAYTSLPRLLDALGHTLCSCCFFPARCPGALSHVAAWVFARTVRSQPLLLISILFFPSLLLFFRLQHLLFPSLSGWHQFCGLVTMLACLVWELCWRRWQWLMHCRRQGHAESAAPSQKLHAVRAESSTHLVVSCGRWVGHTRQVCSVLRRLKLSQHAFQPDSIPGSIARVLQHIAAFSVGLAGRCCSAGRSGIRRATRACIRQEVLATMVAAGLSLLCVTHLHYLETLLSPLSHTPFAYLAGVALSHGHSAATAAMAMVADVACSLPQRLSAAHALGGQLVILFALLLSLFYATQPTLQSILSVSRSRARMLAGAASRLARCLTRTAAVDPPQQPGAETPADTLGVEAACAQPSVDGDTGETAGDSGKTATAQPLGSQGHTFTASRLGLAVLLAACVVCGVVLCSAVSVATTMSWVGQLFVPVQWVTCTAAAHHHSLTLSQLVHLSVSQAYLDGIALFPAGLAGSTLSLAGLGGAAALNLGLPGLLFLDMARASSQVLPCFHAATHDALLVLLVRQRGFGRSHLARVYSGGVLTVPPPTVTSMGHDLLGGGTAAIGGSFQGGRPVGKPDATAHATVHPQPHQSSHSHSCQTPSCSSCSSPSPLHNLPPTQSTHSHHSPLRGIASGGLTSSQIPSTKPRGSPITPTRTMLDNLSLGCRRNGGHKSQNNHLRKLCNLINPVTSLNRLRVCLTGGINQRRSNMNAPRIQSNVTGIALKEQCEAFQRHCLQEHLREPQDQRFFILEFELAVGHTSAIHALINTTAVDADLAFITPKEHAIKLAADAAQRRRSLRREADNGDDSANRAQFVQAVNDAYPAFKPKPNDVATLARWEAQARATRGEHELIMAAQKWAKEAADRIETQEAQHVSRKTEERYQWLLTNEDPILRARGDNIRTLLSTQRDIALLDRQNNPDRYKEFDSSQYLKYTDMEALDWLVNWVVEHHGNITYAQVLIWRTRVMSKGQMPSDAFARLLSEAQSLYILARNRFTFDIWREVLDKVSRPGVSGSECFWPPTLYTHLDQQMVTSSLQDPTLQTNPQVLAQRWVSTAQALCADFLDRRPAVRDSINRELSLRGEWKTWSQLEASYTQAAGRDSRASPPPRRTNNPPAQRVRGGGGANACNHCGQPGHWVKDCPQLKQQMGNQPAASPARARTTMTTTPATGTNPLSVGMNPKAAYNQGQAQRPAGDGWQQAGRRRSAPPHGPDHPHCEHCSRIAEYPYRHPGPCFLQGQGNPRAIPASLNPRNPAIRAALNALRRKHNVPVPPPPPEYAPQPGGGQQSPRAAPAAARLPGRRAHFEDVRDPTNPPNSHYQSSHRVGAMMRSTTSVLNTTQLDSQRRFTFLPRQQQIVCECGRPLGIWRTGTDIRGVYCNDCSIQLPASALPPDWTLPVFWVVGMPVDHDPFEVLGSSASHSRPFGSAVSVTPPPAPTVDREMDPPAMLRLVEGDRALTALVLDYWQPMSGMSFFPILLAYLADAQRPTVQGRALFDYIIGLLPPREQQRHHAMWEVFVGSAETYASLSSVRGPAQPAPPAASPHPVQPVQPSPRTTRPPSPPLIFGPLLPVPQASAAPIAQPAPVVATQPHGSPPDGSADTRDPARMLSDATRIALQRARELEAARAVGSQPARVAEHQPAAPPRVQVVDLPQPPAGSFAAQRLAQTYLPPNLDPRYYSSSEDGDYSAPPTPDYGLPTPSEDAADAALSPHMLADIRADALPGPVPPVAPSAQPPPWAAPAPPQPPQAAAPPHGASHHPPASADPDLVASLRFLVQQLTHNVRHYDRRISDLESSAPLSLSQQASTQSELQALQASMQQLTTRVDSLAAELSDIVPVVRRDSAVHTSRLNTSEAELLILRQLLQQQQSSLVNVASQGVQALSQLPSQLAAALAQHHAAAAAGPAAMHVDSDPRVDTLTQQMAELRVDLTSTRTDLLHTTADLHRAQGTIRTLSEVQTAHTRMTPVLVAHADRAAARHVRDAASPPSVRPTPAASQLSVQLPLPPTVAPLPPPLPQPAAAQTPMPPAAAAPVPIPLAPLLPAPTSQSSASPSASPALAAAPLAAAPPPAAPTATLHLWSIAAGRPTSTAAARARAPSPKRTAALAQLAAAEAVELPDSPDAFASAAAASPAAALGGGTAPVPMQLELIPSPEIFASQSAQLEPSQSEVSSAAPPVVRRVNHARSPSRSPITRGPPDTATSPSPPRAVSPSPSHPRGIPEAADKISPRKSARLAVLEQRALDQAIAESLAERRTSTKAGKSPARMLVMQPIVLTADSTQHDFMRAHIFRLEDGINLLATVQTLLAEQRDQLLAQTLSSEPLQPGVPAPSTTQRDQIQATLNRLGRDQHDLQRFLHTYCQGTIHHDYVATRRMQPSGLSKFHAVCTVCGAEEKLTWPHELTHRVDIRIPDTPEYEVELAARNAYQLNLEVEQHMQQRRSEQRSSATACMMRAHAGQPGSPSPSTSSQLSVLRSFDLLVGAEQPATTVGAAAVSEVHPARLNLNRQDQIAREQGSEEALARLRAQSQPHNTSAGQQPKAGAVHITVQRNDLDPAVQELIAAVDEHEGEHGSPPLSPSTESQHEPPTSAEPRQRAHHSLTGGLDIHPDFRPTITVQSLQRCGGPRGYEPTHADRLSHEAFLESESCMHMLTQQNRNTSLLLFHSTTDAYYCPELVMLDTGADLAVCVSQHWADQCGLTLEPGSPQLVGVGGIGGAKGLAVQSIRIQLGGSGERDEQATDIAYLPTQGIFSMVVRPYIMTAQLKNDIGCEVILGGAFLRACLGRVDYLTHELELSPAWLTMSLADLRVRIPCNTCKNLATGLHPFAYRGMMMLRQLPHVPVPMREYIPAEPTTVAQAGAGSWRQQRRPVLPRPAPPLPVALPTPSNLVPMGRTGLQGWRQGCASPPGANQQALDVANHVLACMQAQRQPAARPQSVPSTQPRPVSAAVPNKAAMLSPGFPQAPGAPTPEQFSQRMAKAAAQTAVREGLRTAQLPVTSAIRAQPAALTPIGVVYPLDQLRTTGRLREGFVLDLHPVDQYPQLSPQQLEHVVESVTHRVLEKQSQQQRTQLPVRSYRDVTQSGVPPVVLQQPVPARSAPAETLLTPVHVQGAGNAPRTTPTTHSTPQPSGAPSSTTPSHDIPGPSSHPLPSTATHPQPSSQPPAPTRTTNTVDTTTPQPAGPSQSTARQASQPAKAPPPPPMPSQHGMSTRTNPKPMRYGAVAIMRRDTKPLPKTKQYVPSAWGSAMTGQLPLLSAVLQLHRITRKQLEWEQVNCGARR